MSCFVPDQDLTAYLYKAMEHYRAGSKDDGDSMMQCAKPFFKDALSLCSETKCFFKQAEEFYDDFASSPTAGADRAANYQLNKLIIDSKLNFIHIGFNSGAWFNSGFFMSEIQGRLEGYPTLSSSGDDCEISFCHSFGSACMHPTINEIEC